MKVRLFSIITLSVLPIFIARQPAGLSDFFRNSALTISRPFFSASQSASSGVFHGFSSVQEHFKVWQENEQLKDEVVELKKQIQDLRQDKYENERLQSLLRLKNQQKTQTIVCRVLSRDITSWREWLAVDKGSEENILKNMAVETPDGLVGRVLSSAPHSARVMLITDSQSRVGARIQDTRDTGIIEGDGGPLLALRLVDLGVELKVGQVVETSGLGGIYPKGIVIGEITQVWTEKNGLFQGATVKPKAALSKLEEVACVRMIERQS